MVNVIHVIDPDLRRRAFLAQQLSSHQFHTEIYEDLLEFLEVSPSEGIILAADVDTDRGGQRVTEVVRTRAIELPVIGYSDRPPTARVVEAMIAGAASYLRWPFEAREVVKALDNIAGEGSYYLSRERNRSQARRQIEALSPRERQVLAALMGGTSNKGIAKQLQISHRTVEIHRSNLMAKLGVRSLAEAVRIGLYAGLDGQQDAPRAATAA